LSAVAENIFDEIDTPIGGVPSVEVMQVWHKVEPLLRRVVKPQTGYALEHVLMKLQLAHWQLWVMGDFQAVAITEIQNRPLHNVLWCQFVAGDNVDDWLDDWEKVQSEYAKAHNCVAVEWSGRRGWTKFKQKYGKIYKVVMTTYRKEL
jgi:hypothetical protein